MYIVFIQQEGSMGKRFDDPELMGLYLIGMVRKHGAIKPVIRPYI